MKNKWKKKENSLALRNWNAMEYNFLLPPKIETVNETIDILGTLYFDNRLY